MKRIQNIKVIKQSNEKEMLKDKNKHLKLLLQCAKSLNEAVIKK